jgi:hypothetical protein
VFVSCYDEVSASRFSTFEHTIVGFVRQKMKMQFGFYNNCNFGNRLKERGNLILLPAKFIPQKLGKYYMFNVRLSQCGLLQDMIQH